MAVCEKCGKINMEDAACGICGGRLVREGSHVTCPRCNKDIAGVCNGKCDSKVRKVIKYAVIGLIVIALLIIFIYPSIA